MMGGRVIHTALDDTKPSRILDAGCGTGAVTHTLATSFPKAQVFGLDMAPVPVVRQQLGNISYVKGNILTQQPTEWAPQPGNARIFHGEAFFDFIFSRLLIAGMSDWPGLLRKEYAMLVPGGFVEVHDLDLSVYDRSGRLLSDAWQWHRDVAQGFLDQGMDWRCGAHAKEYMRGAAFNDIEVHEYKGWVGGLAEQSSETRATYDFWGQNYQNVFTFLLRKFGEGKGRAQQDVEEAIAQMKANLPLGEGLYLNWFVTVGRKPVTGVVASSP